MLDENLPTFLLRPSQDKPKQNSTFLYSQHGSDFQPAYTLRHLDPEQHASKNRYAVALYDAFNPDVLYGEVLLIPEWTQPTLNQEQIRANGGVPPPPEPILPGEFVIQLYNPDLQVTVRHKPAGLTSAEKWEFEIPQMTFRTPSTSALDRSQDDPSAIEHTPKLSLKWKKDGRLSKDLACYLSGKAYNSDGSKKRQKEPDITIAILKNLREVTVYEPNLARVEVEDPKGFEIVLLLGSVVIRDVFFGTMKETFNINPAVQRPSVSNPTIVAPSVPSQQLHSKPSPSLPHRPARDPRVPPTDPRSQWEIDAETQRLRKEAAEEEKRRKQKEEVEQKRLKKMLEAEEKNRRKKQAEVDKETERLRKLYGKEDSSARPKLPARPLQPHPPQHRNSAYVANSQGYLQPTSWGGGYTNAGPYMSGAASQSAFLNPQADPNRLRQKSSIFNFGRNNDNDKHKLHKKRSSVW